MMYPQDEKRIVTENVLILARFEDALMQGDIKGYSVDDKEMLTDIWNYVEYADPIDAWELDEECQCEITGLKGICKAFLFPRRNAQGELIKEDIPAKELGPGVLIEKGRKRLTTILKELRVILEEYNPNSELIAEAKKAPAEDREQLIHDICFELNDFTIPHYIIVHDAKTISVKFDIDDDMKYKYVDEE